MKHLMTFLLFGMRTIYSTAKTALVLLFVVAPLWASTVARRPLGQTDFPRVTDESMTATLCRHSSDQVTMKMD
jgi:hypothetical protein